METLIIQALKNDLQERYDVVEVWEDNENDNFRIVFELVRGASIGHKIRLDRAIRYVDVMVVDGCILLWSQNRKSIRIDYCYPDSMDKVDEFIMRNCVDGAKRRSGQLQLKTGLYGV